MQTILFTYSINNLADLSEGRLDWNEGYVYNNIYHGGPNKYISEPK